MNRFCLLMFLFLFSYNNVFAQKKKFSGNPIIEGNYADPEATIFGNKYWIYPTYSDKYRKQVFLDAFSSKDLIKWEKHERIVDTAAIKWAYMAMWAPAIVEKYKKYYLFFSANDIQSKERNNIEDDTLGGIGIAVADKPEGPFKDYLGKPLINNFYNGAQPIDQFVFKDVDGKYYIFYGGWGHCNVAQLSDDFKSIVPNKEGKLFKEITPKGYTEGPFMFMRNGKYYFTWSEGGWTGPDYGVAYAIADSPFGPFTRVDKILESDSTIARGAGHHSIIHNEAKDLWYMIYHRRPLDQTGANTRVTCIDEMQFEADGKIKPIKMTFTGVKAQKIKRKRK